MHNLLKAAKLDLSNNKFNLTKNDFYPVSNFYLNLRNNSLQYVGNLFAKKSSYFQDPILSVVTIDLSLNSFESINFSLEYLKNLQNFYIQENRITSLIENAFLELKQLRLLDISKNRLSFIERNIFRSLSSLEILNLSCNLIKQIHQNQFSSLINLIDLDISDNSIEYIHPQTFSQLARVRNLYVHKNNVKFIDELDGLSSIKNIYLDSSLLLDNFTSLINLKESIQVRFYKKSLGISYLRSVNVITYPQDVSLDHLEEYCVIYLFLIRHNISLNLKTAGDFDYFFSFCKPFSAKSMFIG
jgi:Leucine-rich repeat (LRR) protein